MEAELQAREEERLINGHVTVHLFITNHMDTMYKRNQFEKVFFGQFCIINTDGKHMTARLEHGDVAVHSLCLNPQTTRVPHYKSNEQIVMLYTEHDHVARQIHSAPQLCKQDVHSVANLYGTPS